MSKVLYLKLRYKFFADVEVLNINDLKFRYY